MLMEDGIRLPNAFSFGPLEAGRGDYTDLDTLKRIEIVRGRRRRCTAATD